MLCKPSYKVPILDRDDIRDQRAKTGSKGTYQLGPVDRAAVKRAKRKLEREMRHTVAENSDSPGPMDVSSSSELDVGVADSDYTDENKSNVYNNINAPRLAAELVRAGESLCAGAAIYNALLDDLKDANLLIPPPRKSYNDLRMDHSKIKRIIRNDHIIYHIISYPATEGTTSNASNVWVLMGARIMKP